MSEYATNGAILVCTCGSTPSKLQVTVNTSVSAQSNTVASTSDKAPMANIKPFGTCAMKPTPGGFAPCVPAPTAWTGFLASVQLPGGNPLLKTSKIMCSCGGCIQFQASGQMKSSKVVINPSSKQIDALQRAAIEAVPFCEECEKKKTEFAPKIIDIYWMDEFNVPRKMEDLHSGETVTLYIQVEEGAEGEKLDVEIAAPAGQTVNGGQASFQASGLMVDSYNLTYIDNFCIDGDDNGELDIADIYAGEEEIAEEEVVEEENSEGYYYDSTGKYVGKAGSSNDVYLCSGEKDGIYLDPIQLMMGESALTNEMLLRIAGWAYGESGYSKDGIKQVPFVLINHHNQLVNSGLSDHKNRTLNDTLVKMRNNWDDVQYAHETHYGADGNPAFRAFLDIELNEAIDYDKNAEGRNGKSLMKLAVEYAIKATRYYNGEISDIANGAIGWHGRDILRNSWWKNNLYIHTEHAINGFEAANWTNSKKLEETAFESTANYKGSFGTTLFYKSTEYAFSQDKKGLL